MTELLRDLERAAREAPDDRAAAGRLELERRRRGLPWRVRGTTRGALIVVVAVETTKNPEASGLRFWVGKVDSETAVVKACPTNVGYCYSRGHRTYDGHPASTREDYTPFWPDAQADYLGATPNAVRIVWKDGHACIYQERGSVGIHMPRMSIPGDLWKDFVSYLKWHGQEVGHPGFVVNQPRPMAERGTS